ncbi:hypothetical protein PTKIN_Ptkin15bG0155100 [Pterospermum kingtungense]
MKMDTCSMSGSMEVVMETQEQDQGGGGLVSQIVVEKRPKLSFKDTSLGGKEQIEQENLMDEKGFFSKDDEWHEEDNEKECPNIVLSNAEKERLRRPWHQTLIVKLMGRSIRYNYLFRSINALRRPKS